MAGYASMGTRPSKMNNLGRCGRSPAGFLFRGRVHQQTMPTVHLTNGERIAYDRVTVKASGFVRCYDQKENPEYERGELGSDRFLQTNEVAYPPHNVEKIEGEPVAYQRPAVEGV